MAYQNSSASLSVQDMKNIKQALQTINQKMSFLGLCATYIIQNNECLWHNE